MATIVVTGSAGGIGGATVRRLRGAGHEVIGVDVRDAEVEADLSTPEGRAEMVEAVGSHSGGSLDGLVAGAGVYGKPGPLTVAINYFGAIATLQGLRPLLAGGTSPSAVAISSNSASTQPALPRALVDACLAGDEEAARTVAADDANDFGAYAASKLALARWVRRHATSGDWIGAGIRLNAIAPGFIDTAMTAGMADFVFDIPEIFPMPMGRVGTADEMAALLAFLLSPDAGFCVGSVVYADGGTDAAIRAEDVPSARPD